jgi:hypothetical protein
MEFIAQLIRFLKQKVTRPKEFSSGFGDRHET